MQMVKSVDAILENMQDLEKFLSLTKTLKSSEKVRTH